MQYFLSFYLLFFGTLSFARNGFPDKVQPKVDTSKPIAIQKESKKSHTKACYFIERISVTGEGTAPTFAQSPAQAYLLAKRAATNEAYRLLAERVKGVKIEGKDTIENMAIKESSIRTKVSAMIRNATIIGTTYKDGLCEVEMEMDINKNNFK